MSMNICFVGVRDVQVIKTGKFEQQRVRLNVFQTPTLDTCKIANSPDPKQAYIQWVLSKFDRDEEELVFAKDDIFCEGEPIGTKIVNEGKLHVAEFLQTWIDLEQDGYEIVCEVM